jgi:serine/threonine protein phosphatase PrpC
MMMEESTHLPPPSNDHVANENHNAVVTLVSTASAMNPSRRCTMEDVHVYFPPNTWHCPDPHMAFLGVYDGHGGTCVRTLLSSSILKSTKL